MQTFQKKKNHFLWILTLIQYNFIFQRDIAGPVTAARLSRFTSGYCEQAPG